MFFICGLNCRIDPYCDFIFLHPLYNVISMLENVRGIRRSISILHDDVFNLTIDDFQFSLNSSCSLLTREAADENPHYACTIVVNLLRIGIDFTVSNNTNF
nr:unnamed protein product [Spirometra erinaceieuropaei]